MTDMTAHGWTADAHGELWRGLPGDTGLFDDADTWEDPTAMPDLVACVRDAARLRQAREIAHRLRRMRDEVQPEVGALLDLLASPPAGDPDKAET